MKIVVFGANGPTGRLLTAQALAAGHHVTAVTRRPAEFPLTHAGLTIVEADVFDPDAVDAAISGSDSVLSTLGVPFGRQPITAYSAGTQHIASAMARHGLSRLVVVGSSAVDAEDSPEAGFFFNKVLQPFITRVIGKTAYDDMRRMESLVRATDLNWTIMRASGLFDTSKVTDYSVTENWTGGRFTARADLAAAMLQQLTDDRFLRTTAAVSTTSVTPGILQLIWREGIKKR